MSWHPCFRLLLASVLGACSSLLCPTTNLWSTSPWGDRPKVAIANPLPPVASTEIQMNAGLEQYRVGQYDAAKITFQRSIEQAVRRSDPVAEGLGWTYLSLAEQQLQNWNAAQQAIQRGMNVFQTQTQLPAHIQALAFNTQGRLFFSLGQTEQALLDWQQAEQFYRDSQDATGMMGSQINQAQALTLLGFHHRACKLLFRAISLDEDCNLAEAAQLTQTIQAFESQSHPQVRSLGLITLSNLLRLAGNYNAAQALLSSLEQSPSSVLNPQLRWMSLGRLEQALYRQQIKLFQRTTSTQEQNFRLKNATSHAKQSIYYFQMAEKQADSALAALQAQLLRFEFAVRLNADLGAMGDQSSDLKAEIEMLPSLKQTLIQSGLAQLPPSQTVIQAQLLLAEQLLAESSIRDRQQALHYATTAFRTAQNLQNPSFQAEALGLLGKIYEQNEQWQDAQDLTQQALALSTVRRDSLQVAQWQWQLGRIYQQQSDRTQALQAYRQAVEHIGLVRQDLRVMHNEIEFSFRENVEPMYREYVNLLLASTSSEQEEQANIRQALQAFDDFQVAELEDFLNCNLPMQAKPDPDFQTAFIYPIFLRDRIEIIVQLPNNQSLRRYTTVVSQQTLDQTLIDLRRELEQLYPSQTGIRLSQKVYNWLLSPAEDVLAQNHIKNLVFVLDGPLRNIPIAALHNGQEYLIESGYSVALLPSLQLFDSQAKAKTSLTALTFGLARGNPPLPNVPQEVKNINQILDGKQYLDQAFTRRTLTSEILASSSPIVHLATHGQFSSDPEETYLLTWDQKISGNDLGQLLFERVNSPGLKPIDLLVLSACKTAKGDHRAILGLAGIAIQSGARSTLSSLWSVNDRSTALMMRTFYQELAADPDLSKAEALRRAQVKLLKIPGYASPRFWGAYVLVGNWK